MGAKYLGAVANKDHAFVSACEHAPKMFPVIDAATLAAGEAEKISVSPYRRTLDSDTANHDRFKTVLSVVKRELGIKV